MTFRSVLYILLAATLSTGVISSDAATKRKARSTQTSRKKRTYTKSKRTTGKKRTTTRKAAEPPREVAQNDSLTLAVNSALLNWIPPRLNPGGLRVMSVKPDSRTRTLRLNLNENYTYLPVTRQLIDSIGIIARTAVPDSLTDYQPAMFVNNRSLAYYITKVDKLPEHLRKNPEFVTEIHPMVNPSKGMENDIIALWHSHGRYFKPGSGSWMWQRPLLFESVEDTYTMSYVLPFLVPMLENAGAYVMLPRERNINRHEVIVDNDTNPEGRVYSQPYYKELNGSKNWGTGEGEGFIYDLPDFRDTENPFENGTYRQIETVKAGRPSVAAWYADIPADGEYAIYVSYKTLPNSAPDARYTVNYSGGTKEFKVNQTMGGSTWIYLGTFPLEAGYSDSEPIVTLTNISDHSDKVITADAVKIGGGMGNIARSNNRADLYYDPSTPDESLLSESTEEVDEDSDGDDEEVIDEESNDITDTSQPADPSVTGDLPSSGSFRKGYVPTFRTSGLPRYLEGARYWLHWAGFPESVYSPYHGSDDYKDDYTSRGQWVNYLAGGSRILPNRQGLGIPVDLAFALHSDAGKRSDDSFVGTLGIYFSQNGDLYADGTPRINSRMLTDLIMRQITADVRQQYESNWTRRSMWDKSYVEARVPEVPTTLIELMSHQNFADMQYGLDPGFKFTVARAIYKAMARFLAERKDRKLVIQPLPVCDFAITRIGKASFRLKWQPTPDPVEPTAMPHKYIIMERTEGELGFHKVGETTHTHFDVKVKDDEIHSFRIIAVNDGGASFPSETLAFRESADGKTPVMIINGFTRVSGPSHFSNPDGTAGFNSTDDFGVPYINDISFTGHQTEFRRGAGESFGRSNGNYIDMVIAGNTFDYPAVHGDAIADLDMGFVSASVGAVEKGEINLSNYPIVDLILGKQKATKVGNGKSGINHRTFPDALRSQLDKYLTNGGHLVVSGQYVASDLSSEYSSSADSLFIAEVLGVAPDKEARTPSGSVRLNDGSVARYSNTLNDSIYIVERPDVLLPADSGKSSVLFRFDNGDAAAIQTRHGKGLATVMSVPVEAIIDSASRRKVFSELLKKHL